MKELIYKNISRNSPRKREISFEENEDRFKSFVTRKRVCKYFVKAEFRSRSQEELDKWVAENQEKCRNLKNCHILKQKDASTGEELILCKMIGEFFIINGLTIYKILYVNMIKVQVAEKKGAKK